MAPKQKALEKQSQLEADKETKRQLEEEKRLAAEWSVGSNSKEMSKQKELEDKEMAKRQKAQDMAALLAAEEAELGGIVKVKTGQKKKKEKDDFDLLNAALKTQPKTKAQKEAEQKKKELEEQKQREAEVRRIKDEKKREEDEIIRKNLSKGIVMNHTDELMVPINNKLDDENFDASGLDSAIDMMSGMSVFKKPDDHPEKRMKALYNSYYETQLIILKEEQPGLKLSQYKDRIFEMWKKAKENPKNQTTKDS